MTIAGYAIGAQEGILYLRGEYTYLREYLEAVLEERRRDGLLGALLPGRGDLYFDIRIQMGAGAYVCGEETALLSSCEGRRGDPRNRPPFPAQRGYLGYPTVVNNVETLCCVTKILEEGTARFREHGTEQSTGTKLLSVCGDCREPGVYELPFGVSLRDVLRECGASDAAAVQMGGPSGRMVGPEEFDTEVSYEGLSTGGAVMVFGGRRDLLWVVEQFLEFFTEESCGYCTPCRVGNVVLRDAIGRICRGRGEPGDLRMLEELGATMRATSRCGLGQTAPNPVLSSLQAFRPLYEERLVDDPDGLRSSFDLDAATAEARDLRKGAGS
jgi:[NiFe] hydrogenase diaphorase moiety large subunit